MCGSLAHLEEGKHVDGQRVDNQLAHLEEWKHVDGQRVDNQLDCKAP